MPVPSVTSAQSGPVSCTWKCASSMFGQFFARSGPKSVITPRTSLGDRLVRTVNVVLGIGWSFAWGGKGTRPHHPPPDSERVETSAAGGSGAVGCALVGRPVGQAVRPGTGVV